MMTIIDNIQLTRKHRVVHVLNEGGGLMWTGKSAGQALTWLYENGHKEARFTADGIDYELNFSLWPI